MASAITANTSIEAFRQVHPREYLRKFLKQNVRPDGRGLTKVRKTTIVAGSVSTAAGSALVRCGQSAVLCGIKAEIAEPTVSHPRSGYIVPNIDLSPMCSPKFRPGPPSDQAQCISQKLMDLIVGLPGAAAVIDLEQLCIEENKAVWVLYCDIVCLNYDGAIFDTAVIALFAALRNLRLPVGTYDADQRQVTVAAVNTLHLTIGPVPVAITFAIFDNQVFVDPNEQEEAISDGSLTIVCNDQERLVNVVQKGIITTEKMNECIFIALTRAKEVAALIETS